MRLEVFHDAVVRHRRFTHRVYRHVGALGGVTRDWLFYRAAGGHGADRHRFVFTGNFTRLQRFHQPGLRRHGFRHHHQTGGVFIQTVHDAGTRHVGDFRVMMQQRIEHRAVRVTGARCTTKSRGLLITRMSLSS